jgi:hypothetical protein
MLHYYKFRQELFAPVPAREIYHKPGPGKGWPEECPPIRTANSFGFDLLANFDVTFIWSKKGWRVEKPVVLESDFDWSPSHEAPGQPLTQEYAWFWERGQKLPHPISDNVYKVIQHQVKISSFLFLKTDPNEILLMTEIPNLRRPWRALSAVIETDWYPASYPWHCVVELDPAHKKITIKKGEPLARLIPLRRDTYFAQSMTPGEFDAFFDRGQHWLASHGRIQQHEGVVDITRTYVKQQAKSRFLVLGEGKDDSRS